MPKSWQPSTGRFSERFSVRPLVESQCALEEWFLGDLGDYLLAKEREVIKQLPVLPGYHLMELGVSPATSLLSEFPHLHKFQLCSAASGQRSSRCQAITDFESIPLPSDTIDAAVLHHSLEFSQNPHAVLNEVTRVVAPGGYIVLLVFNPFSLMGLAKWPMLSCTDRPALRHHSLRLGRVLDWLRILDCKTESIFRDGPGSAKKMGFEYKYIKKMAHGLGFPGGMFYTIVAKKYEANYLIDKKPGWVPKPITELGWMQTGGQMVEAISNRDNHSTVKVKQAEKIR